MKSVAPSSATTSAAKKASPLWWMLSLGLHAILLCVLFLLFPYKEFIKPAARAKSQQPLVNQKTLEATTRRLEEKQSEELARKLREIEAITADIQSVESTKRVEHAEFDRTFTQLSPELAGELISVAREKLGSHSAKQMAEDVAWSAYQKSEAAASAILTNLEDPAFKATIESQAELLKAAFAAQEALSFHQASLLETQQKLAGRLGFLKARQAEIVARQADLVAAWEKTMDSGGTYLAGFSRALEIGSSIFWSSDSVKQSRNSLHYQRSDLAKLDESIAKRSDLISSAESTLEQLIEEQKSLDPTDPKRGKEFEKRIKKATEELSRQKEAQTKQNASKLKREQTLQTAEAQLQTRSLSLQNSLSNLQEVRKSLHDSRRTYVAAMEQSTALQNTLDAAMTAALSPNGINTGEPKEP